LFLARALATTRLNKEHRDMAKKTSVKQPSAKNREALRMLIVEGRFYDHIADGLLRGASAVLDSAGASYDRITVPGALEIPAAIVLAVEAALRKKMPYDGVVALGCVIQGETYHFELVANESARGLMDLTVDRQIALGNGVLTVDTEAQALARSGEDNGGKGNKGAAAARAALAMVALKRSLARA
jgi:6,7-dimethyl-8-ribityllumazine synthase